MSTTTQSSTPTKDARGWQKAGNGEWRHISRYFVLLEAEGWNAYTPELRLLSGSPFASRFKAMQRVEDAQ